MDILFGTMISLVSLGLIAFMVSGILQLIFRWFNFLWFLVPLVIILFVYSIFNPHDIFYLVLCLSAAGGAGLIQFLFFIRKYTDKKIAEYMKEK